MSTRSTISANSFAQSGEWQSLFDGKTLNGWKQLTGSVDDKVFWLLFPKKVTELATFYWCINDKTPP